MPIDPRRAKALFQTAHDLTDPTARTLFLDQKCGDDADLRRRVEALLAAVGQAGTHLEQPLVTDLTVADFVLGSAPSPVSVAEATVARSDFGATIDSAPTADATAGFGTIPGTLQPGSPPADAKIGTLIAGRYKLRQSIGEGGMGTVYLAEQTQPVRRQVALKLIRAGMDSRQVLARFESERQALAIMDHPHIARVLDAGTTDSGHPFFVMELVKGVPLTDYCDAHRLDLPTRLNLFRQICGAVQHAHQKGIIHRDLKPTNILVESHDDTPVPKVIDFGLAKAISGQQLAEATVCTGLGTIAGTPLYMAPEQATFNTLDIDTRADIYALGVILYELLTGSTPIRRESLHKAALDEMLRVIREDEPPLPSHRISTLEALPSVAATRQVEPVRLGRFVRGDLDWIVMKALAKERARRYDSAVGLANDVERFLKDEPVLAGPPTARYRATKFIRRHRGQVIAGLLVALALVGGVIGTTLGLIEARDQTRLARAEVVARQRALRAEAEQRREAQRQEALARSETAAKEVARQAEAEQRRQADQRLAQVTKMNEILGSIFRDLDLRRSEKAGKPAVAAIGERLDQAAAALEGESIGDPLAVARMQKTLGESQLSLGHAAKATELLRQARVILEEHLGPDHPETLSCSTYLANAYDASGQRDQAVALQEQTYERRRDTLGPNHPSTLTSLNNLARDYELVGQTDRAIPLFEQALAARRATLGPDHRDTLASMNGLANAYRITGQVNRATALHEQALAAQRTKLGSDHPDTLISMSNLANDYQTAGQVDRAIALHEEALEAKRTRLGADHPQTLTGMNNLATAYLAAGRPDRAIPILEQALEAQKAKLAPDHPETLTSMVNLATAYRDAGRTDRGIPILEQVLEARKTKLGPDHPDTQFCMTRLSTAFQAIGRPDRAVALQEEILKDRQTRLGSDDPATLAALNGLANGLKAAGQWDRAIALHEQAFKKRRAVLGPNHPDTLISMNNLASAYQAAGHWDRAITLHEETLAKRQATLGPDHSDTLLSMNNLSAAYQAAGQRDRAIGLQRQILERRRAKFGPEHPDTLASMTNLAGVLKDAGQLDEAIALHEQTLAIRRAKLGPDHPEVTANLAKLIGCFEGSPPTDKLPGLIRDHLETSRRRSGPTSVGHASALAALGNVLVQNRRWAEAEPILSECLTIREREQPDSWTTANARLLLGTALFGLHRFDDARPLLVAGYEKMKQDPERISPSNQAKLRRGLDSLIQLAEATNKPEEAQAWRVEKARIEAVRRPTNSTRPEPANADEAKPTTAPVEPAVAPAAAAPRTTENRS